MSSAASGETLSLKARCIYQLRAGLPTVSQDLTIVGNGATLERSDAPDTPAFTILSVADSIAVAVSDLNFANGDGAISVTGGSTNLTVQGGRFTDNHGVTGGAIYDNTGIGNLSVTGATFIRNTVTGSGGAIYTGPLGGDLTLTGDTFVGNAAGEGGGAILDFNVYGGVVTDCSFYDNRAADGGAIAEDTIEGGVIQGVFSRNTATDDGGAIANVYAYVTVGGTIFGNHAGNEGGGIYLGHLEYAEIGMTLTATLRGNSAEDGGGLYSVDDIADLTSSTIDSNAAMANGGGIYNEQGGDGFGTINLGASQVDSNRAGAEGGGMYTVGGLAMVTASGTPIDRNTAATGGGGIYDSSGGTVTLTNSPVLYNEPDNCEPAGSITGCTSRALPAPSGRSGSVGAVKNRNAATGPALPRHGACRLDRARGRPLCRGSV
ncbi:MAG TPA: hypothetical protein VMC83_17285 [Streptosporangiaceae bacterium]|nr:hypothetical protein [Streptosporangiaceae bacterium]